jgi:hypothetical protein
MISLLTSNKPAMTQLQRVRSPIVADDFSDRKPVSFTNDRHVRNSRESSAMNLFDIVVCVTLVSAAASGFRAGLLRSAVTILAYLIAMPTAIFLMSLFSADGDRFGSQIAQGSPVLFGTFLITGIVLSKFMRMALEDAIGPDAGIADRLAGAALVWPPACLPHRFAAAAGAVSSRTERFEFPASQCRGLYRSAEANPADLNRKPLLICISSAAGLLSGSSGLARS